MSAVPLPAVRRRRVRSRSMRPRSAACSTTDFRAGSHEQARPPTADEGWAFPSRVRRNPSTNETVGSYPRLRLAAEMSARESRTSPARGSAWRGTMRVPKRSLRAATSSSRGDAGSPCRRCRPGRRLPGRLLLIHERVDDVGDVNEIARLQAVAEDGRDASLGQGLHEDGDDAGVGLADPGADRRR